MLLEDCKFVSQMLHYSNDFNNLSLLSYTVISCYNYLISFQDPAMFCKCVIVPLMAKCCHIQGGPERMQRL